MAIYNEILAARFARMLQKVFSMKGEVPTKQLSGELMAVFPMFNGPENRVLEGWSRYMQWYQVAAQGAGNIGGVRWRVPSSNQSVIVFEKITVTNVGAASDTPALEHGAVAVDLPTPVVGIVNRLDARQVGAASLIASQGTKVDFGGGNKMMIGVPPQNATSIFSADFILDVDQEITVLPGDALQCNSAVANQVFTVAAIWRERPLEDSEKAS